MENRQAPPLTGNDLYAFRELGLNVAMRMVGGRPFPQVSTELMQMDFDDPDPVLHFSRFRKEQEERHYRNARELMADEDDRESGIYALMDPDTSVVMYVGMSRDIRMRYRQHCANKPGETNVNKWQWVYSLAARQAKPVLVVLERCSMNLAARERHWITHYRALGQALLNMSHTKGGA